MLYNNWSLSYVTAYIRDSQLRRTSTLNAILSRCISFTAHEVFDRSPERHVPSMHDIECEALAFFVQRTRLGTKPTKFQLCTALNCCAKTRNSHLGSQIHAKIFHIGLDQNLYINSSLVNAYAKCGATGDAMSVFNGMEFHDTVSWTSMISGLSQNGEGREALCLFKRMLATLVRPNCFTYVGAISGCTEQESVWKCGELLHAHVIILGHENNFVTSSLIDYYSKCGNMEKVVILFEACATRDPIHVNSMISAYSHNLQGEEALKLFMKMRNADASLSEHALTSILDACGALTVLQQGRQVHALVTKMGSVHNVFLVGALIDMYSKCGNIDEALCVFDEADYKNNILWTSVITACAQSGRSLEALEFFDHLVTKERRFKPDHVCFTVVLTACNHSGLVDKGIGYFEKMRSDYNLGPEIDQYACLIDLYARKGDLKRAKKVMEEMPFTANAVMWSSFLSCCKEYGNVELGREAAYKLFGLEPNSPVPYLILEDIYAGAGLWNEVVELRKLMNENGVRKCAAGCSWVEVENEVHVFSVGDSCHPQSEEIHLELRKLSLEMLDECSNHVCFQDYYELHI
ncbi:hypothetical protein L6452_10018 [Arctium lappa]|uniref:Uncharacterized protein n=1 Tax=Arctium lappa TaxID=4217 RepID=A0ACB9DLX4_ARCLA|nr:hypothetical protein L6452_10018 [Arctium lappa]